MGLGIIKNSITTLLEAPLASGQDPMWEDNTWIVEHLRQLADHIAQENPSIYSISLKSNTQHKIPTLVIEHFNAPPSNPIH